MGILRSDLFKDDDKLEACAARPLAHLKVGSAPGLHITKIHAALEALRPDGPAISPFEKASMTYGPTTAKAVLNYKKTHVPPIINISYQNSPDDIVGQMTIKAMDVDLLAQQPVNPPPSTDPKTVAESKKAEPVRWLLSTVQQLEGFQSRLKLGAPDFLGLDKLPREVLKVHFHIDSPETEPVKLTRIITNYKEMLKVLSTQSASVFKSASDEEAKAANNGSIPHAWTNNRNFPDGAIHFTSTYVNDPLSCQQAVMVHESMHFVEPEPGPGLPDITEADPRYDDVHILPPEKTIHNPASYAAGAFHLATGTRKKDFCP
jgi:hypothetical protein